MGKVASNRISTGHVGTNRSPARKEPENERYAPHARNDGHHQPDQSETKWRPTSPEAASASSKDSECHRSTPSGVPKRQLDQKRKDAPPRELKNGIFGSMICIKPSAIKNGSRLGRPDPVRRPRAPQIMRSRRCPAAGQFARSGCAAPRCHLIACQLERSPRSRDCDTMVLQQSCRSFHGKSNIPRNSRGASYVCGRPLDAPADDNSFARYSFGIRADSPRPAAAAKALEGTVVSISPESVFVDIGRKLDGVLPVEQFRDALGRANGSRRRQNAW